MKRRPDLKPKTHYARVFFIFTCIFFIAISSFASTTKVFTEKNFSDFVRGEVKTSSLSSEGEISPAPAYESLWKGQDELVWKILVSGKDTLYFSTGNEGKIHVMEKDKVEVYCDLEELSVFAMAFDKNGVLYAGASPGGKIYRITEKNRAEVFFETGQKYIWDIVFDKNDNLFAATGIEGKLFKIDPKGIGEVFYQASDKNLMDILFLSNVPDESVYISTHDKGRIYRVHEKDKAFVLFDSGVDEIRAIVEGEPGYFYAALNSLKTPSTPPVPPKPSESQKQQESDETEGGNGELNEKDIRLELPIVMGKKSSIVKLDISGYVWPFFSAPESPIHALIYDQESETLQAGIGDKGKLYSIEKPKKFTVVFSTEEKHILSFAKMGDLLYMGTSQTPNIYRINWKDRSKGEYISPVHDAKTPVKWGYIRMEGDLAEGTEVKITTRSGNTEEPDKTWSEWEKEKAFDKKQLMIGSPVARFFQYKLLMSGKDSKALPLIKKIDSYYIPPNQAPEIEKIEVRALGKSQAPPKMPVKDKDDEKSDEEGGKNDNSASIDAMAHSNQKKLKISWKVRDPEGDKLRFNLYFKGEGETIWKEIEEKLDKSFFLLTTEPFPDGRYQIKVVASDLPSNPQNTAIETEALSDPFVIDNSPPELIKELTFERINKQTVALQTAAQDKHSIISAAQYSINADEWFRVNPKDEIFDSQTESFSFVIRDMKEAEALVTFMVTDAEGNTLIEKILIKPKETK